MAGSLFKPESPVCACPIWRVGVRHWDQPCQDAAPSVALETAVLLPNNAPFVETLTEKRLQEQRLFAAIADLPKGEREALLLVYREGFSQRETAERLGRLPGGAELRLECDLLIVAKIDTMAR